MAEGLRLNKVQRQFTGNDSFRLDYQEKVGSLEYLVRVSRWGGALESGTSHLSIFQLRLVVGHDERLFNYANADFAGNLHDRRSTTGFMITFARAFTMWRSVDQRCVSLSTLEAECHALSTSMTESQNPSSTLPLLPDTSGSQTAPPGWLSL